WSMLYILALQPFSVLATFTTIRSDFPVWRVPCQSPAMSPRARVALALAGAAVGGGAGCCVGCSWAFADPGDAPNPNNVIHVNADSALNIIFAIIVAPWSEIFVGWMRGKDRDLGPVAFITFAESHYKECSFCLPR